MSSALEEELKTLLSGGAIPAPETFDVAPGNPQPLRLRHNVCYIVMGVILNEQDEVLMMQEAKAECRGSWYLPAGRLEKGETLVEGVCREVKEETGLVCQPLTLLAVEERGTAWVRFVFLAQHTGGSLKTSLSADAESLQAAWWDTVSVMPLRCKDIVPLIQLAKSYHHRPSHPLTLPALLPCPHLAIRLLLLCLGPCGEMWVLQSSAEPPHLPVTVCGPRRGSILTPLRNMLEEPPLHFGILGLQHQGGEGADGVCFNIMAGLHASQPPLITTEALCWGLVQDEELKVKLGHILKEKTLLPLYS
ncbi:8-oxo-dGDP phosphatase NUDT18 [Spea bombifrons]|uniref:8-oxo-dGDP phosphatase NUDT18 n=1 Tax=Spea bombifrons TaxID=233779 RepID=UPI00234A2C4D|nr:8-oxo-dGDP phosphatase NUDT18 [Spea bombifrons]